MIITTIPTAHTVHSKQKWRQKKNKNTHIVYVFLHIKNNLIIKYVQRHENLDNLLSLYRGAGGVKS